MGVESSYYSVLTNTTTLTDVVATRIFPIKLPQDVTYPAMFYNVEAEIEGRLSIDDVEGLFSFENTYYASSYGDIIKITEAFRNISKLKGWNIAGFTDLEFVVDKNVYGRTLIINVMGKI